MCGPAAGADEQYDSPEKVKILKDWCTNCSIENPRMCLQCLRDTFDKTFISSKPDQFIQK